MAGEPESLDVDEGLDRRRRRHWFDRLVMLSDGVFAIAITLLAFNLHELTSRADLPSFWRDLAVQLDAYALSVIVIGVYWLAHRRFITLIRLVDAPVTVLNLVFLALVALLPAATELLHSHGSDRMMMLVYGMLVVSIGAILTVLWGYAALYADLVFPEVPRRVRWYYLLITLITPPFFLLLVMWIPTPFPGLIPAALVGLFLIGWRMRVLIVRRLAGVPPLTAPTF